MNPRRVLALLAAVTAAVVLLVNGLGNDPPPQPDRGTAATTSPPAEPAAPGGPVSSSEPAAPPSSQGPGGNDQPDDPYDDSVSDTAPVTPTVPGNPRAVAEAFADAWTRHTGPDAATWARRLADMSTPELADLLRDVDPAVVPANRVTGPAMVAATDTWANAAVPTDAGTLQLQLFYTGRWVVAVLDWTPAP